MGIYHTINVSNSTSPPHQVGVGFLPPPICKIGGWDMYPPQNWWRVNPFDYVMPVSMFHFTMFFIFSQAICHLFRPFKKIKFLCYMLAGILLGPSLTGKTLYSEIAPQHLTIVRTHIAYIGLTYYVFIMAVKIEFSMISRLGRKVWTISAASLLVPYFAVLAVWTILYTCGIELFQSKLLWSTMAFNVSMTWSANLSSTLDELGLLTTDLGELATSCALLNDVTSWIFFAVTGTFRHGGINSFLTILSICIIVLFVLGVLRHLVLWIIDRTPEGQPVEECYIVGILLGVLAIRCIVEAIGGNAIQGPVLLGLIIPAGPPLGSALTQRVETIITELLMPFVYMEMGAAMNLKAIDLRHSVDWSLILGFELIIVTSYVAKFVATVWASLHHNIKFRESLKLGMFMSIRGVLEFVTYLIFKAVGILPEGPMAAFVLSALAQTALVVSLISIFCKPQNRTDELDIYFATSLQTTLFDPEMRIVSCIPHEDDVPAIISLLEASTGASPVCADVIHMIELIGQMAPSITFHKKHMTRCGHNGCHRIMSAFRNYCKDSDHRVTMQPYTLVATLKSMHELICRQAQEKRAPLVLIPFSEKDRRRGEGIVSFNSIISKLQAYASCTVGALVDRGSRLHIGDRGQSHGHGDQYYRTVVFFIGGADDREALALGARMLSHPWISVEVQRIQIEDESSIEGEARLNDLQVEEFRRMIMDHHRSRAVLKNVGVVDWEQALRMIQTVISGESCYDLVMVGQRQGNNYGALAGDMLSWTENPELGLVGDMIASSKYSDRNSPSVLVVKHSGQIEPQRVLLDDASVSVHSIS